MSQNLTPDTTIALLKATQLNTAQGNTAHGTQKVRNAAHKNAGTAGDVQGAAQDFEAMFISEMMKPMFAGISTDAPFGGGKGEEVFRGLLLQEYGKLIAQTGEIGLSTHVRQEMIRMQEAVDSGNNGDAGNNRNIGNNGKENL